MSETCRAVCTNSLDLRVFMIDSLWINIPSCDSCLRSSIRFNDDLVFSSSIRSSLISSSCFGDAIIVDSRSIGGSTLRTYVSLVSDRDLWMDIDSMIGDGSNSHSWITGGHIGIDPVRVLHSFCHISGSVWESFIDNLVMSVSWLIPFSHYGSLTIWGGGGNGLVDSILIHNSNWDIGWSCRSWWFNQGAVCLSFSDSIGMASCISFSSASSIASILSFIIACCFALRFSFIQPSVISFWDACSSSSWESIIVASGISLNLTSLESAQVSSGLALCDSCRISTSISSSKSWSIAFSPSGSNSSIWSSSWLAGNCLEDWLPAEAIGCLALCAGFGIEEGQQVTLGRNSPIGVESSLWINSDSFPRLGYIWS